MSCQILQHYYSKSSREFLWSVVRMKYRLDPKWTQAVGETGWSSCFSAQLGCEWGAGRERQLCCLFAGGQRPVGSSHCKTTLYLHMFLKKFKAVQEHLNIIVSEDLFVYLFCYVPFVIWLSSWQWPWFTVWEICILKSVCQNENATLNISLHPKPVNL